MSIENNLTRIADALEGILAKFDHIGQAVTQTQADEIVEAPKPEAVAAPVAPSPDTVSAPAPATDATVTTTPTEAPAAPPSAPQAPAAPPSAPQAPAAPAMTQEDLDKALVAEATRLGSADGIRAVIQEYGVSGITQIDPSKYQELLDKVKAL